jgi:hypothetical protein
MLYNKGVITHCYIDCICMYVCCLARLPLGCLLYAELCTYPSWDQIFPEALLSTTLNLCSPSKYKTNIQSY